MFISVPIGEVLNSSKAMKGLATLDTYIRMHTQFSLNKKKCFEIFLFLHHVKIILINIDCGHSGVTIKKMIVWAF